jgi:hypothetical protein
MRWSIFKVIDFGEFVKGLELVAEVNGDAALEAVKRLFAGVKLEVYEIEFVNQPHCA